MSEANLSQPNDLFWLTNALQPVRRAWIQAISLVLVDFDLPIPVASVVIYAARGGDEGIRQNMLAEEVGVNPGALVRTLDQAEATGLLERREVPGDRRAKTVHLLPAGRAIAAEMEKSVTELRNSFLGDLPPEDIAATVRTLHLFGERVGRFLQQERTSR